MKYLVLILKGFIIGVAKIIPGVSGAVLAISMGIYEDAIKKINNLFEDFHNNFKYLFSIGIGIFLAIMLTSKLIIYCLNNYYLPTMLLFIGLIIGGLKSLFKKSQFNIKNIILFTVSFLFVFLLSLIGKQEFFISDFGIFNFVIYIIIGLIDATTMVIPGISGTAVMMLLGCYELLLNLLSSLDGISNIVLNLSKLIPFVFGVAIGVIILTKIMSYLFDKKSEETYAIILGFATSSILVLSLQVFKNSFKTAEIILGIILLILGLFVSRKLDK